MELQASVGETAGKVWSLLNVRVPQTLAQLKKNLVDAGEFLSFAVGWQAREDKVTMTQEKRCFKVALN